MVKQILDNKKLLNIAIVGCGKISRSHFKAIILNNQKARITAICDLSEKNLSDSSSFIDNFSKEIHYKCKEPAKYNYFDQLIKDVISKKLILDLLIIATPSGLHATQAIQAANAGIHVCTEKPMATNWEDGLRMVEECRRNKIKLFVVKQNRFNKILQLTKKQIENGRFGKLAMVSVNVFWQRPQKYYDQASWRGTVKYDGGALMNQASHYVDLLDWMIGPIEYLSASNATISRKIDVEDTSVIQLKWKNGALGTMAVTMLTFPKNLEASITILGEKGTVKIGGNAVNKIDHWIFEDENEDDEEVKKLNEKEYLFEHNCSHYPYYENMLNSINGIEQANCPGEEGLRSLELLICAYKSAQEKKFVYLPLHKG